MTKIDLSTPLDIEGARVTALTMREPTVGDQVAAQEATGSDAAVEVRLFANLCEVAPEDIMRLTMRDYGKLQKAYSGFL